MYKKSEQDEDKEVVNTSKMERFLAWFDGNKKVAGLTVAIIILVALSLG